MLRRILVLVTVAVIGIFYLNGCKKSTEEPQETKEAKPRETVVKTIAEYDADAKKQITKENMAEELDKIEKEIEQETSQKQ